MYDFSRTTLVWIAFLVFIFGTIFRLVSMYRMAKKEKVVLPYFDFRAGMRSIFHWLLPYGSRNMRMKPVFTGLSFLFHFCLLFTPIFALGHNILIKESWNVSWWTFPDSMTNTMTIIVVTIGLIFALRRMADPTVRFVTSFKDFIFLTLVLAPYITGIFAYYNILDYQTIIILHMWTGAIWLMAIPFTRISHMIFFPITRAYMGSEFGYVRNAKDW